MKKEIEITLLLIIFLLTLVSSAIIIFNVNVVNLSTGILGVIIGGFITLLSVYLKDSLNRRREDKNKKIELYSKLRAIEVEISQLIVSRFEAYILSDYYEIKNKKNNNNFYFNEAVRLSQKSENMVFDITQAIARYKEILGQIQIYFNYSTDYLREMYNYKVPDVKETKKVMETLDESVLEESKEEAVKAIQVFAKKEFKNKIEGLLKDMENKIP